MDDGRPFGAWLKQRRKDLDLTQEALAERVGCSVDMVRKVESGVARPSRQLADLLATQLEIAPDSRAAFVLRARAGASRSDPGAAPTRAAALQEPPEPLPAAVLTNPYKGLRAFQEADAPDFVGRDTLTRRLCERLADDTELARFLAVV